MQYNVATAKDLFQFLIGTVQPVLMKGDTNHVKQEFQFLIGTVQLKIGSVPYYYFGKDMFQFLIGTVQQLILSEVLFLLYSFFPVFQRF